MAGYTHRITGTLAVAVGPRAVMTLDPTEIPDEVRVKGLSTEQGRALSIYGPGKVVDITLEQWRATKRLQELEFDLARALTVRYTADPSCEIPPHALFPQMLRAVQRFLAEKVRVVGNTDRRDIFLEPYFTWALDSLSAAIISGDEESPELARYETHRGPGSSRDVDFWTSRPVREAVRTRQLRGPRHRPVGSGSAAFYLDTDPRVVAFVKNANLGSRFRTRGGGRPASTCPTSSLVFSTTAARSGRSFSKTKGYDPAGAAKIDAAWRWVHAVNAEGSYGRWAYRCVGNPGDVPGAIKSAVDELVEPPRIEWKAALGRFGDELQAWLELRAYACGCYFFYRTACSASGAGDRHRPSSLHFIQDFFLAGPKRVSHQRQQCCHWTTCAFRMPI